MMVDIKLSSVSSVLKKTGISPGGRTQVFATTTAQEMMKPFVPVMNNGLRSAARPTDNFTAVIYQSPYAHYQYMGVKYVDPITKKGSFFSESYGHWSRPNVNKEKTNIPLKYHGGGLVGPKWDERMVNVSGDKLIDAIQKFIDKGNG